MKDLDRIETLLDSLAEKDVRFKGYIRGDRKQTLEGIVRRGGIFTISTGAATADQRHGSLLHSKGIEQILTHTGMDGADVREQMRSLRDAVRDYASLNDVLAIVGNRLALLVTVEPNATAHDAAVKKLLEHSGNPVFVPRPPPRLFDAVDPTEGGGGGDSNFELRVPRRFYFRQVGKEDRSGLDLSGGLPSDRMKWKAYAKDEVARWEVLSVRKKGRSVPVSSFDVAVLLPDHVVVFRNQNLFFDARSDKIEQDAKSYAESLRVSAPLADEIVKVQRSKGGKFVGSLLYNTLANRIIEAGKVGAGDAEVMPPDKFIELMKREDDLR